jgi:3-(3-hydroxy-phenyl)propionate hydroxylase
MGQGMCAGIRDVANLAWKLAASTRGCADESVLDSYQSERAPNVRKYVTMAVQLGGLINSSDPESALRMARRTDNGVSRMESPICDLGPGLGSGSSRGRLFGQPRLRDGRLMDDLIGYAPVLVADAGLVRGYAVLPGLQLITTDDAFDLSAELAELGVRAAVLRPDRYILATANDLAQLKVMLADTQLAALLTIPSSRRRAPPS